MRLEKLKDAYLKVSVGLMTFLLTTAVSFAEDATTGDDMASIIKDKLDSGMQTVGVAVKAGVGILYIVFLVGIPAAAYFTGKKKAMQSGSDQPNLMGAIWAVVGLFVGGMLTSLLDSYFAGKGVPLRLSDVLNSMIR